PRDGRALRLPARDRPHVRGAQLHPQGGVDRRRRLVLLALRRRRLDRALPGHLRPEIAREMSRTHRTRTGRRSPIASVALLVIGLVATGGAYALVTSSATANTTTAAQTLVDEGKKLFDANCASCHGLGAVGTGDGPSLIGVGAASVDFQVGTGRMPMAASGPQAEQKPPQFTDEQVKAMAA